MWEDIRQQRLETTNGINKVIKKTKKQSQQASEVNNKENSISCWDDPLKP
ncbi:hypothetical protein EXN66_Car001258 [Channa argus]|uniref:Uncharacterized protein n=1 Tax=Channa argus TaxID=215402 RepID=A0A6G1QZX8_CHAAH|nr:hypothetical protein EXN66_Car001258 [Channa argus]